MAQQQHLRDLRALPFVLVLFILLQRDLNVDCYIGNGIPLLHIDIDLLITIYLLFSICSTRKNNEIDLPSSGLALRRESMTTALF